MFISKLSLPRRTFLRGVGATLALPLLDAMVPAATALAQTPAKPTMRFGAIMVPQGAVRDAGCPRRSGPTSTSRRPSSPSSRSATTSSC